ncbi:hypothetical protein M132_4693, partial [Bacteroides fragilis str. S24L15]
MSTETSDKDEKKEFLVNLMKNIPIQKKITLKILLFFDR